jgi:hypothetical protein
MPWPASTACSGAIRESARVQELLVKLDRALNKLSHKYKMSTRPKLLMGQPEFAMVPNRDGLD